VNEAISLYRMGRLSSERRSSLDSGRDDRPAIDLAAFEFRGDVVALI